MRHGRASAPLNQPPPAGSGDAGQQAIRVPTSQQPVLSIIVDCEEGFDWSRPVQGTPYDLDSISQLFRIVERTRALGAKPTLLTTYPVMNDDGAWRAIAPLLESGDISFGAHLHPWVTPPFGEAATMANSYQGNLPPAIEAGKVETMVELVRRRTGTAPTLFKAGRSGFGALTAKILVEHGFQVDHSYMPGFSYAAQGGPSFSAVSSDPFFFQAGAGLLEVPDTGGFVGLARSLGPGLFPHINTPALRGLKLTAALARGGLMNRIPLTPEGVSQTEARRLTRQMHADGLRIFQLSFHSTSLVPGGTSYVPDAAAVTGLLNWLESYIIFFTGTLGGTVVTPPDILAIARANTV